MKATYNDTEVNKMTEKERLFLLIGRLNSDEVSALSKIVSSMVYSRFPVDDEELTEEEERELKAAIKEMEAGKYTRISGDKLDELFS
ncbi:MULTISPECIES: hypothetical protein [Oceanobacillus]|uniref:hypothetical protein n=1 Tax=Oceanobacillus TaxID=182709 RepID=UPI0005958FBE|nr:MULTISPECIES: hypothetical protein [Oceanobacillus]